MIRYWLGFNLFFAIYVLMVLAWALPRTAESEVLLVPIFLTLLPLANATLDWVSLGVTRGLLHAIRHNHHSGVGVLAWAVLDIALALLFLFAIVSLTTAVVAGVNAAAFAWSGNTLLDLGRLFRDLEADPWSLDLAWIHFMMLSTLIPTLAHFLLAGVAAVLFLPDRWRRWILNSFDKRDDARWGAFLYVSLVPPLAIAAPAGLLWGLYVLVSAWHGVVGMGLLTWARGVARLLDPSL